MICDQEMPGHSPDQSPGIDKINSSDIFGTGVQHQVAATYKLTE